MLLVISGLAGCLCAAAPLSFFSDEVEYRLGESVMIPVRMESKADENVEFELKVDQPDVIEVLKLPEILAGHNTGFARIQTLAPGEVTLSSGDAKLRVKVGEDRPLALLRSMRPRFTSPAEGAYAWGTIAIGAEIWVGAPGVDRMAVPEVLLHFPDGSKQAPDEAFPPIDGPFWRFVFLVDTAKIPPGECVLTISCKPLIEGDGALAPLMSDPHSLTILAPPSEDEVVFSGECEDMLDTPRAERMGMEPPGVVMDSAASGYRAVALRRNRPAWVIQPEIKEPGRYQWVVRARGALAGGAYPSLGIITGENASDSGSARLVSSSWHDVPVGRPIRLDEGTQWVGLRIANEFNYRNQVVRTAEIDRFELRRVPDSSAGSGGGMMMMEGGAMMMQASEADADDEEKDKPPVARRLKVAFTSHYDGESINGRVQVRARLHTPAFRHDREFEGIRSELWVNDSHLTTAYGRNPAFTVHPHDLKPGSNSLKVHAISPCGNHAISSAMSLLATSPAHPEKKLEIGYDSDRYDLNHRSWERVQKTDIRGEHPLAGENGPTVAHAFKEGERAVRLRLPNSLSGDRRLSIHARAVPGAEPGVLAVTLHQPNASHAAMREMEIGRITPGEEWAWHPLAAVDLASGRKTVHIRPVEGETALAGFSVDTRKFIDAAPPVLDVLYPKPGGEMSSEGDALVLRAFDDLKLSRFEVRIDGEKSPLDFPATQDTGPMVLHLPSSLLAAGTREIEVTVIDTAGKRTTAQALSVEVGDPSGSQLTHAYPRAVRLATTLGYGMDARTMAAILTDGEAAWLDGQFDTTWGGPHDALTDDLASVYFPDRSDNHVRGRVITDLLATRHPARARFALFVQNHFSTWMSKTGSTAKWEEHRTFRDAGFTRFQDLLLTSATSPAMMVYLDQQNSLGRQLNENYAREVMELHTVGVHAGYRQEDVTSLAQLLTGWGAQREAAMDGGNVEFQYRFSPYLNDGDPVDVFGLSIPEAQTPETADDRIRMVIEMLAARPQTARFIAEKTAVHYLGMPVDEAVVNALASEFLRSGGDMRRMMRALVDSPRFMAVDVDGKIMTPIEFGVVHQRAAGSLHPWSVIGLGDRSGRNLFDRASPDGYPEANEEYADSNYQLQKWSFCKELEQALSATLPHGWFDAESLKASDHRNALIDFATSSRIGRAASSSTREALHAILQQDIPDQNQRRQLFGSFLHMMPEFQIR